LTEETARLLAAILQAVAAFAFVFVFVFAIRQAAAAFVAAFAFAFVFAVGSVQKASCQVATIPASVIESADFDSSILPTAEIKSK